MNVMSDIVPLGKTDAGNALRIRFSDGRVRFPEISQVLLLAPAVTALRASFAAQSRESADCAGKYAVRQASIRF